MIYCLVLCAVVIILDQVTKLIVINTIPEGTVIEVIKDVFNLTYIENTGAAFGMLSDHRWVFMVISVVAILLIVFYIWKEKPESMWIKTPLAFVLGGGIGNMIDRCFRTGVIDFIDADFVQYPQVSFSGGFNIRLADFPIFNVADCFITVGCVMLVIYLLFVELPKESKKEKSTSANAEISEEILTSAENVAENDSNEQ
ncbi:MAG: signal peptidase II [Clostridia bacterium]|nr:signal peptidase II [Clostridia bacterium]